jgi:drug/metabolite transporter (DMT)-like permease
MSKKEHSAAETSVENPIFIFIMAAGAMIAFSVMNVFVKIAAIDYSMAQIVFARNAFALFLILYMVSRQSSGKWDNLKTSNHFGHFWRGFIGVAGMFCFFKSFDLLPLSNATAIHFAGPLLLTILSVFMLNEKVGKHRWGAVIVGLMAVWLMVWPQMSYGGTQMTGSIIAFMAAVFAAFAMIFVRKLGRTEHAMTIVFYFTIYGMIIGAIGMAFTWQPINPETIFFLIMTGLIGGVGQIMLTYAYAHAPAAYVAPFSYLAIVVAIGADILIWQTFPAWYIYAGSFIIIMSGLYIVRRETIKHKKISARVAGYGLSPATPTDADLEESAALKNKV